MEECLRAVGANHACPTDGAFAYQVRLQLLGQRAAQVREQHNIDHPQTAPPPTFLYLKALQAQLQELRETLSPTLKQQGKLSGLQTRDKLRRSELLQIIQTPDC